MPDLTLGSLFTGKWVRLAAHQPGDHDLWAQWSQDAEHARQLDDEPAEPRAPEYYSKQKPPEAWRGYNFAIRTLADDKLIGFTSLFWINWHAQNCIMAVAIGDEAYRGRGYGTDAVRLTVSYAFRELGMHRVMLGVMAYNTRAIRVYEKCGFVREAVRREAIYRDGVRWDVVEMGILRHEWEAARQTW